MKIRLDFVTNSSSSCFLIATKNLQLLPDFLKDCNYIYLDKDDNLASNFMKLLVDKESIEDDEYFNKHLSWLKLLNLDNEDCINYLSLLFDDYFVYYSPSILDKIKVYIGYYLIFYQHSLWTIPKDFNKYVGGKDLILVDERTL